jgi:hypothetical protein
LSERLTTVAELLGRRPDRGEIESAVSAALSQLLGCALRYDPWTQDEAVLADRLHRDQLGLESFVYGLEPARGGGTLTGRDGPVNAYVRLHPGAERRIDQVWVTGNFVVSPARAIPDLEAALRGVPLLSAPDKAIELLSDDRAELRGASRFDVAAAIANAAKAAPGSPRRGRSP